MDLATHFTRLTTACLMFVLLSGGLPDQGAANVGATTRVSVDSTGIQTNGGSFEPVINADGRFVAFTSDADNLVPNDTNEQEDVFVHQFSPAAVVNDLVSLSPDVATTVDTTPVPGGPAGTFTITATFTNTSPTVIHTRFFQVSELSGGNLLVNADGDRTITGGNIGATLTPDVGDDVLSPGEEWTTVFTIGLTTMAPFRFFVNVLGVPNP